MAKRSWSSGLVSRLILLSNGQFTLQIPIMREVIGSSAGIYRAFL